MKRLNKMPKMTGRIPLFYDKEVVFDTINLLNDHSDIINYLVGVIEENEKRIELLERKLNGN